MRVLRHALQHWTAPLMYTPYMKAGDAHGLVRVESYWSRDALAIRDNTSDHLLYRQRILRPAVRKALAFCLPPRTFICSHFARDAPKTDLDTYFYGSYRVLSDAVDKLLTFKELQDAESRFVYKALRCTRCSSELAITLKPTKTADILIDDEGLRSSEWLIEIARYAGLDIMKAPDEPEW